MIFFVGVLVGNKTDLSERRSVTAKEAEDFAASNGLEYFDVSAVSEHQYFYWRFLA